MKFYRKGRRGKLNPRYNMLSMDEYKYMEAFDEILSKLSQKEVIEDLERLSKDGNIVLNKKNAGLLKELQKRGIKNRVLHFLKMKDLNIALVFCFCYLQLICW